MRLFLNGKFSFPVFLVALQLNQHFLPFRLRRSWQPETFLLVSGLYMALCKLQSGRLWVELLFLCRRILHLPPGGPASCSDYDPASGRCLPVY